MPEFILKKMMKDAKPVHTRGIEIATYPVKGQRVVVEGWLRDERLVEIYRHWDQKPRQTGPVHGLCVRLLVGGFPLEILDAEAQMPTVPTGQCVDIKDSVKKVIGTTITAGYSERVRNLIGGIEGCTHLTHLVVVMGPAALHGAWTVYAQNSRPAPKTLEEVEGLEYLINSCHLWAPDGVLVRNLKETIDRLAEKQEEDV